MRIFRYKESGAEVRLAVLTEEGRVYGLSEPDFMALIEAARIRGRQTSEYVQEQIDSSIELDCSFGTLELCVPIEAPEVWAAGVTYARSKEARNYEATGGKLDVSTFYAKVYDADRPELFMKSTAARTVGPEESVGLRSDSNWQVPEAELGLVLDRHGVIVGYTAGNDMSCRDIEGENPLYLPQAKIWRQSCAIGPVIRLAETLENPYDLSIACRIYRKGVKEVDETANTGMLKRRFDELVSYLKRDNVLFDGTVLLTGTCIVPPNQFTLEEGDRIEVDIEGIGVLANSAAYVGTLETV